jgi:hypothetical protein
MNLQEALEALLDKRRELEGKDAEWLVGHMHAALAEAEDTPDDIEDEGGDLVASLVAIGGAVLALLATDYEPVSGLSLDEWIANRPPKQPKIIPVNGAIASRVVPKAGP